MSELDEKSYEIYDLKIIRGYTFEEIGEKLDCGIMRISNSHFMGDIIQQRA